MEDPEIVDIAPGGDVVFICTADDGHLVRIKVLSLFVSTASPVLKAMLGPKFKEGNTLAMTSNVEVILPEDEPSAMILIFKAMHMRISSLPSSLDITGVKQLALAVDKYDCAGLLAPMAYYWVQARLQATKCDFNELNELLHVTYLLDQNELFGQVGLRLILESPSTIRAGHDALVPACRALEMQRIGMVMSISKLLEDRTALACTRFGKTDSHNCHNRYKYLYNFIEVLQQWKLWSLDAEDLQLKAVLQAMRMISFRSIDEGCPAHKGGRMQQCDYTSRTPESIAQVFEEFADKLERGMLHLCLSCTKAGDPLQQCEHRDDNIAFRA